MSCAEAARWRALAEQVHQVLWDVVRTGNDVLTLGEVAAVRDRVRADARLALNVGAIMMAAFEAARGESNSRLSASGCCEEAARWRALLVAVMAAAPGFDDPRLDYVEVQIDRGDWQAARAAVAAFEAEQRVA